MAIRKSRILEKKRHYQGEEFAESLVNWLNFTQEEAAIERIHNLIGVYQRLMICEASRPLDKFVDTEREGIFYRIETKEVKYAEKLKASLKKLLSYYKVVPSIITMKHHHVLGDVVSLASWTPLPGSKFQRDSIPNATFDTPWREEFELPGGQMGETGALFGVLDLIRMNMIWKLGYCRCKKYYFRRFAHQRFCDSKCRLADFRDSDESREKRNEYARKLYHLHKTGKVK